MELHLFAQLRASTAVVHRRLERRLDLMGASLSRERYVAILLGFRGFVVPWEAALARSLGPQRQDLWMPRRKAPLLERDLAFLGADAQSVRRPAQLPGLGSLAAAIGSMYVMEGATLGGQLIGPHLRQHFGWAPGQGHAYFEPYGADTGRMWHSFRERATHDLPPSSHAEALASAVTTFELLHACFEPAGVAA